MKQFTYREADVAFGQTMLTLRTATGLTQSAVAESLGVSRLTISSWEAGKSYPKPDHLKHFIELSLRQQAFKEGGEAEEIKSLWRAAHQKVRLDESWLNQLLVKFETVRLTQPRSVVPEDSATSPLTAEAKEGPRLDWGDAPNVLAFYGREAELTQLSDWVIEEGCRVVSVLGMGGIGKSALTITLMHRVAEQFEVVVWRSLRDAPPCGELLKDLLQGLAATQMPPTLEGQVRLLVDYLQKRRILLVLDNLETLLEEGHTQGQFRAGYEDYGLLLNRLAQSQHQSCVLITSREKPVQLVPLEGADSAVRTLRLSALEEDACEQLLLDKKMKGSEAELSRLSEIFAGNPLALKIVAQTIVDLFDGELTFFLAQAQDEAIFGGVKALLAGQFARLSSLEQKVLLWLGVFREPTTLDELLAALVRPVPRVELLEALMALHRRSLIERGETPGSFSLQSVVLEYATARLVDEVASELVQGQPLYLLEYALMQAQAKDYVRESQARVLLGPVLAQLNGSYHDRVEGQLSQLLEQLRELPPARQGYGGGNILNLLIGLGADLTGRDFSGLNLWQVYLAQVELYNVNLAGSDLKGSVFKQDFEQVSEIALSPDGKYLVTGSASGKIQIWRFNEESNPGASFSLHSQWKGHQSEVFAVVYSPDGKYLASGGVDQIVRLWDATNGQNLRIMAGHTNAVNQIVFSPDGEWIASASFDYTVRLWRVATGESVAILEGHTDTVYSVAFSPDGELVASSGYDGTVRLWEIKPQEGLYQPVAILRGHQGVVSRVVFSPDGQTLFSSSGDATLRVWSVASRQELQVLEGHFGTQPLVAISPDGATLASGGSDNIIRLWRIDQNKVQLKRTLYCSTVLANLAFSLDSSSLIAGYYDGNIRVWSVRDGKALVNLQGYTSYIQNTSVSVDGAYFASSCGNRLLVWRLAASSLSPGQEYTPWAVLKADFGSVFRVVFGANKTQLASAGFDGTIQLWDLSEVEQGKAGQGQAKLTFKAHTDFIYRIAFNLAGNLLASGSNDSTIKIWSTVSGELTATLLGHQGTVRGLVFSPNGQWLATGGKDGTIKLWDVESFGLRASFGNGGTGYIDLAYHPSGQLLAASRNDGIIEIWQFSQTNPELYLQLSLENYQGGFWDVAFNPRPDLPPILVSGSDNSLRLWDIERGEEIPRFQQEGKVQFVAFTPDGKNIVAIENGGQVKQWNIERDEIIATYRDFQPYEGVNIKGVSNLTPSQRAALISLGAIESVDS